MPSSTMSSSHFHAADLITSKEASRHFGYTSDYVTRLARQGKIIGKRVGNQWFVDPTSLGKFKQVGDMQREQRTVALSVMRKLERVKTRAVAGAENAGATSSDLLHRFQAGMQSLVSVALGTATALAFVLYPEASIRSAAAISQGLVQEARLVSYGVHEVVSEWETRIVQVAMLAFADPFGTEQTEFVEDVAAAGGVVVMPAEATNAHLADIEQAFSDPVEVMFDPLDPKTGIIKPVFGDEGDEFRFLIVPVLPPD